MKSYMWNVCFITALFVAPVAFCEIIYSEDYDGEGSPGVTSVSAFANGYNSSDTVWGSGEMSYYTTEDIADGHCYYEVYAYAEASLRFADGNDCGAMAGGSASAGGPAGSIDRSAYVSLSDSGYWGGVDDWDAENPPGTYRQADGYMSAWTSTSSSHYGCAGAGVYPGSGETAYAHACIRAWCSLSD